MDIDIYVRDWDTHEMLYANKSMVAFYGGFDNLTGKTYLDEDFSGFSDRPQFK